MRSTHLTFLLAICLLLSTAAIAQGRGGSSIPSAKDENGTDQVQQQIARDMAKKANEQRQAAIRSDTDKLVKLSAELKEYVDKSNENVLSMDVIKKAEEIEKLAHSVKEKMKGPN